MLQERSFIEKILRFGRRIIPRRLFKAGQPIYHWLMSMTGAIVYRFPSRQLKIIAITGTKGKSTTVYMTAKAFEEQGIAVAAIGSLGYKIKDKFWPNTLKMTMPGRMRLHKFMREAVKAGCTHLILETTSEGIAQQRLTGVTVDCAVFTNLHHEHIESHGSFENYRAAKQKLFYKTKNLHIINLDDPHTSYFINIPCRRRLTFGLSGGDINQEMIGIQPQLAGVFNTYNALAALAIIKAYGLDVSRAKATIEAIESVPGRMHFINEGQDYKVVVDYAHTPESLEAVYRTLKSETGRLIAVLGACGGGRDRWKRPVFGTIAGTYCDEIILTNEDPYDEDPEAILDEIEKGLPETAKVKMRRILDRTEAIWLAIRQAQKGDVVIITGKGSENSMALADGRKIVWSDTETARDGIKVTLNIHKQQNVINQDPEV